jgi:hypothetical protein
MRSDTQWPTRRVMARGEWYEQAVARGMDSRLAAVAG